MGFTTKRCSTDYSIKLALNMLKAMYGFCCQQPSYSPSFQISLSSLTNTLSNFLLFYEQSTVLVHGTARENVTMRVLREHEHNIPCSSNR